MRAPGRSKARTAKGGPARRRVPEAVDRHLGRSRIRVPGGLGEDGHVGRPVVTRDNARAEYAIVNCPGADQDRTVESSQLLEDEARRLRPGALRFVEVAADRSARRPGARARGPTTRTKRRQRRPGRAPPRSSVNAVRDARPGVTIVVGIEPPSSPFPHGRFPPHVVYSEGPDGSARRF